MCKIRRYSNGIRTTHSPSICALVAAHQMSAPEGLQVNNLEQVLATGWYQQLKLWWGPCTDGGSSMMVSNLSLVLDMCDPPSVNRQTDNHTRLETLPSWISLAGGQNILNINIRQKKRHLSAFYGVECWGVLQTIGIRLLRNRNRDFVFWKQSPISNVQSGS